MAINPKTGKDDELDQAFGQFGYDATQAPTAPVVAPVLTPAEMTHAPANTNALAAFEANRPPVPSNDNRDSLLDVAPEPAGPTAPLKPMLSAEQVTSRVANPEVVKAANKLDQVATGALKTAGQQTDLNKLKAGDEVQLQDRAQQEADALTNDNELKKLEINRDIDKGKAHLDEVSKRYDNYKITDWFDDQKTTTRVLAAVAMGMGAYGAAITGGENTALKIIDGAVNRDRQAKLAEQQKLLGEKRDAKEDLTDARGRLLAADVELRAAHDTLYKQLDRQRVRELAKYGADQATIDGDKVRLGIQEQAAKNRAEMFKGLDTLVTKQYTTPAAAPGTGPVSPENVVYGPGGKPLFAAANKKIAEDGNGTVQAYQTISELTNKLDGLIKQGRTLPGTERSNQMDALQKAILLQVKNLEKAGALDKGAVDVIGDMVPRDAGVMGNNGKALGEFKEFLRTKVRTSIDSMGVDGNAVIGEIDRGQAAAAAPQMSRADRARLTNEYQSTTDPARRAAIARALKAAQ
jgi:hypothetical protein